MAKKNGNETVSEEWGIKPKTKLRIFAVVFFAITLFSLLAALNIAGIGGEFFFKNFRMLFGFGYYFIPLLFILLGISFSRGETFRFVWIHLIAGLAFLLAALGITDIVAAAGGSIGNGVAWPFEKLFGAYAGTIFLSAILIISLLLIFEEKLSLMPIISLLKKIWAWFSNLFAREKREEYEGNDETIINLAVKSVKDEVEENFEEAIEAEEKPKKEKVKKKKSEEAEEESEFVIFDKKGSYTPPPIDLLGSDRGEASVGDIKANLNIIKRTLANFGINVEMDEVTVGPSVTRYALKPAEGVKLAKIVSLQNDLSLALAAHPLRIEAPIPGKSLVGIELPNKKKSIVGLANLLTEEGLKKATRPLTIPLGRGLSGKGTFVSIAKAPHMLIGGTTGSGKSVTIHTIITSLLYQYGPANLRFILVDPKRVELTFYNKIPHLLTPVITDPKKAILALRWAAKEMESRYTILENESVRDITSYHQKLSKGTPYSKGKVYPYSMPYIVIVIDELADIMTTYPRELEAAIVRLAQMSRAVGIHLILSTQRPSVNVITGLIKANIPSRVALQVSSQIDSRTILDGTGAEKLLGSGDMLYLGPDSKQPERIQSAYITEDEVKNVVEFLAENNENDDEVLSFSEGSQEAPMTVSMNLEQGGLTDDDDDELYNEARRLVLEAGKASTSYLQRRLKVGYSRAARLIDILEERGVVGPADGSKPREVLGGDSEAPQEENLL